MIKTALIIIEQALLNFPIVLGAYFSVSLMKVPDLSLESAYVFGAIVSARLSLAYAEVLPVPILVIMAIVASMAGGALVGLMSSTLTHRAKLPHLLSSILTAGIFHGVHQFTLDKTNIALGDCPTLLRSLSCLPFCPELPVLIFIFSTFVLGGALFLRTQLGQALVVHGNNPKFFAHYGISTGYIFMLGLLLSNACAGFSGYSDASSGGFVDLNMGVAKALFCITSLILGKTFVRPSKPFSIFVPIVGVISFFVIQQLLLKVGFNLRFFTMVQSLIVLSLLVSVYNKKGSRIDHLGV